jgi:hypothetical protein
MFYIKTLLDGRTNQGPPTRSTITGTLLLISVSGRKPAEMTTMLVYISLVKRPTSCLKLMHANLFLNEKHSSIQAYTSLTTTGLGTLVLILVIMVAKSYALQSYSCVFLSSIGLVVRIGSYSIQSPLVLLAQHG